MSCKDHEMIARVIQARFGVQRADAEDAASHGLMACIEYGKQDLRYAIASAKNFVRDGFKERRFNDAPVEDIFEDSIHLATAPGQELTIEATQVIERLMSLPPRQREVMALTACEYTPSEIKNCLGVSTKAVNQRLVAHVKRCGLHATARPKLDASLV
jgi:DNA-directed RNA polymerase specialized sigma24 family protein